MREVPSVLITRFNLESVQRLTKCGDTQLDSAEPHKVLDAMT